MFPKNPNRREFLFKFIPGLLGVAYVSKPKIANSLNWIIDYWEPHEYIDNNGDPAGVAVNIIKEAEKRIKKSSLNKSNFKNTTFIERPWSRGLEDVKNGDKNGILSGLFTEKRANDFYITDVEISYSTWEAFKLKDSLLIGTDYYNPVLGKVIGYSYPPEILKKLSENYGILKESKFIRKNEYMYLMLLRKRVDLGIFEKTNLDKLLIDLDEEFRLLEPIPNTKFYAPLFPFISKHVPYSDFKLLNNTLIEMKKDGTIKKIIENKGVIYLPEIPKTGQFAHKL